MSSFCIMCAPPSTNDRKNTCNVLSTSKSIGGSDKYNGFCDNHRSQCGTQFGTCSSLTNVGGGKRSKRARQGRRGRLVKRKPHSGGTYPGYCDNALTQCSGNNGSGTCSTPPPCGGKKRRNHTRKGGSQHSSYYSGYCDNQLSQCSMSSASSNACCSSGGRANRSIRRLRRYGGSLDNKSFVVKSHIKQYCKNNYGIDWSSDCLKLLDRGLKFYINHVFQMTKEDTLYAHDPVTAYSRTLDVIDST